MLQPFITEQQWVPTAQQHVAHFLVLADVLDRRREISLQMLFPCATDHAAPRASGVNGISFSSCSSVVMRWRNCHRQSFQSESETCAHGPRPAEGKRSANRGFSSFAGLRLSSLVES